MIRTTLILSALLLAACGTEATSPAETGPAEPGPAEPALTKAEARAAGKADWGMDICERYGWYGDGECDTFCPQIDVDCGPPQLPREVRDECQADADCAANQVCLITECGGDEPCDVPPNECVDRVCGGIAGIQCGDGQYCEYAAGQCGHADQSGVCKVRPEACTQEYAPVCGCDGTTFSNACQAATAGATVAYEGECSAGDGALGEACVRDVDCADALVCAGKTWEGGGSCAPAAHRGTFTGGAELAIPDNDVAGVTDTLTASGLATVPTDIILDLHIRHSWRSDLRVSLTDPGGQTVVIHDQTGGSEFDLVLEDFVVRGFSLDDTAEGEWTLHVQDLAAGDTGVIERWSLEITSRLD